MVLRRGFEKLPILAILTDNIKVCLYSRNIPILNYHDDPIIMLILTSVNVL